MSGNQTKPNKTTNKQFKRPQIFNTKQTKQNKQQTKQKQNKHKTNPNNYLRAFVGMEMADIL
jgi:hypothetical protein